MIQSFSFPDLPRTATAALAKCQATARAHEKAYALQRGRSLQEILQRLGVTLLEPLVDGEVMINGIRLKLIQASGSPMIQAQFLCEGCKREYWSQPFDSLAGLGDFLAGGLRRHYCEAAAQPPPEEKELPKDPFAILGKALVSAVQQIMASEVGEPEEGE